jgi:hypothetical protein
LLQLLYQISILLEGIFVKQGGIIILQLVLILGRICTGMLLEWIFMKQGGIFNLQLVFILGGVYMLLWRILVMYFPWNWLVFMEHNPKLYQNIKTNTVK